MDLLPRPMNASEAEKNRGHIFNSRATLDTMFQPLLTSLTDSADVLIMGFEDGTVHLSVYNFFEIGSFNLQQVSESLRPSKPLLHCFHPYSTTHPLLVSASSHGKGELYIVPLDLRLMSGAGKFLSLLASKSTQLLNILRYIRQVQEQMYGELQVSQDLPKMFIGNIEKTLQEQCDCTWVHAAYHLVVTGNCYPEVKEWLVDELGERVRWNVRAYSDCLLIVERGIKDGTKPPLQDTKMCSALLMKIYYQL